MALTNKQRLFVEEYLTCYNATKAATRAGYKFPNKQGPRLLVNVGIQSLIEQRIHNVAMSADEVLERLANGIRESKKFDNNTIRALELLGKHHKLFTERHEVEATHTVSGDVLDAITRSLKRGYRDDLGDYAE